MENYTCYVQREKLIGVSKIKVCINVIARCSCMHTSDVESAGITSMLYIVRRPGGRRRNINPTGVEPKSI